MFQLEALALGIAAAFGTVGITMAISWVVQRMVAP